MIPHLVELSTFTSQADVSAVSDTQCGLDLIESVCLRCGGHDTRFGKPGVGWELLVDGDCGAKVVYNFFLGTIV